MLNSVYFTWFAATIISYLITVILLIVCIKSYFPGNIIFNIIIVTTTSTTTIFIIITATATATATTTTTTTTAAAIIGTAAATRAP